MWVKGSTLRSWGSHSKHTYHTYPLNPLSSSTYSILSIFLNTIMVIYHFMSQLSSSAHIPQVPSSAMTSISLSPPLPSLTPPLFNPYLFLFSVIQTFLLGPTSNAFCCDSFTCNSHHANIIYAPTKSIFKSKRSRVNTADQGMVSNSIQLCKKKKKSCMDLWERVWTSKWIQKKATQWEFWLGIWPPYQVYGLKKGIFSFQHQFQSCPETY